MPSLRPACPAGNEGRPADGGQAEDRKGDKGLATGRKVQRGRESDPVQYTKHSDEELPLSFVGHGCPLSNDRRLQAAGLLAQEAPLDS